MNTKDFIFWLRGLLLFYEGNNKLLNKIKTELEKINEENPLILPSWPRDDQTVITMYGVPSSPYKPNIDSDKT